MLAVRLSIRQKEILTGIVILFVFFGTLGGAEAVLQIQQFLAFGSAKSVEKSEQYYIDEATGLRLPVPNSDHGQIHYNALGHRSPEIEMPKPEGTLRIAFLGSSTTLDPYVLRLENTWPHLVTDSLASALPDCRVEYLNAGVPGLGSALLLRYYEHFVRHRTPDVVFIMTSDLNGDLDALVRRTGVHDGTHYRPSWMARNSLFWSKVEKNAVVIRRQRLARSGAVSLEFDSETLVEGFRNRLESLVTLIRESNAIPILLTAGGQLRADQDRSRQIDAAETDIFHMPYMSIEGFLAARAAYNGVIRDVAQRLDLTMVDWQSAVPGERKYFVDSHHFAPPGSRAMAGNVAQKVLEERAIAELSSSC